MSEYENVAVPFQTRGNRQYLSDRQLVAMSWLVDFVNAFPNCFERDEFNQCYWYYPDGVPK